MPGPYAGDIDKKGTFRYQMIFNWDAGVWEKFDGHQGHSRMETVYKGSIVSVGKAFFTLAATDLAYITFLQMQPLTRGKSLSTMHVVASGAAAVTLMVVQLQQMSGGLMTSRVAFQNLYRQGDGVTPFLEVGAGKTFVIKSRPNAVAGRATVTFYRQATTGKK